MNVSIPKIAPRAPPASYRLKIKLGLHHALQVTHPLHKRTAAESITDMPSVCKPWLIWLRSPWRRLLQLFFKHTTPAFFKLNSHTFFYYPLNVLCLSRVFCLFVIFYLFMKIIMRWAQHVSSRRRLRVNWATGDLLLCLKAYHS